MEIFAKINQLPILDVLSALGISYEKVWWAPNQYIGINPDGSGDTSLQINSLKNIATEFWGNTDLKGWPFDFAWRSLGFDTQSQQGRHDTANWFKEKGLVKDEGKKQEYIKSYTSKELFENFDLLKMWGYRDEISRYLMTRGVSHEFIQKNKNEIWAVFKDFGLYDNFYTTEGEIWKDWEGNWVTDDPNDTPKIVSVIMFPCLDREWNMIGMKLRRVDGKNIRGKKSYAPAWLKTGLLYDRIGKTAIIVEGETDYIILKILWFNSVIANLGWVASHKPALKSVLFNTSRVVCMYDNDNAGQTHKKSLAKSFGREILQVDMPIRNDIQWRPLTDINDLYRVGFDTKIKWNKIFEWAYPIGWVDENQKKHSSRFIYLKEPLEYFDKQKKCIVNKDKIMNHVWVTSKELFNMRRDKEIQEVDDICYTYWGEEGKFNTMNEEAILNDPGNAEPKLHPHIEALIENIGWRKKKNIEWLHKAILFKLTHPNSVYVPAVMLYWSGWSGKGTFTNFMSHLFGQENTLKWLKQKDLEWTFDSFVWDKLVVEFHELSSQNTAQDKKMLDRIKSMVCEQHITVQQKFRDTREVINRAWFLMSSNHSIPIQLDSKGSGNRRFTLIKSWSFGTDAEKKEYDALCIKMNNQTFKNKKVLLEYVAWLYETFPEIPKQDNIMALKNEEKANLENTTESAGNMFFEWFEINYPHIWRLSWPQKNIMLSMYRKEIGDEEYNDPRYKNKNFDNNLSHKYERKSVKIDWKTTRWYFIIKTRYQKDNEIIDSSTWEFEKTEWMRIVWASWVTF